MKSTNPFSLLDFSDSDDDSQFSTTAVAPVLSTQPDTSGDRALAERIARNVRPLFTFNVNLCVFTLLSSSRSVLPAQLIVLFDMQGGCASSE